MNSIQLAEKLNMSHFSIYRIILNHRVYFDELGVLKVKKILPGKNTKGGRPAVYIKCLNQLQINFLICLLKNNPETIKLKFKLIKH